MAPEQKDLDRLTKQLLKEQVAKAASSRAQHAAGREEDAMPLEAMEAFIEANEAKEDLTTGGFSLGVSEDTRRSAHGAYNKRWRRGQ